MTSTDSSKTTAMAIYGVFVLVIATVFGAIDRQVLALMAEPLRGALGLSDTQLGLVKGVAFTLCSGLAAFPVGWLADRYGRRRLLALCVLVWAGSTAACGLATDFTTLFLAAAGMGIGEAGITPLVYGLLPQVVHPRHRTLANGVYATAALLGAGLGILFSGLLVQHLSSIGAYLPESWRGLEAWRLAFFLTGMPGPVVILLIMCMKLRSDSLESTNRAEIPRLRSYLRRHGMTAAGVFAGLGLATMGLQSTIGWVPVIGVRVLGLSAADVGKGMGVAYLVGTVVGAAMGAVAVRSMRGSSGSLLALRVNAFGMLIAGSLAAGYAYATSGLQLYALVGMQVASVIAGTILIPTLLQDIAPSPLRSRIIGLGGVIGIGLSATAPVLVGRLSDLLAPRPDALVLAMVSVCTCSLLMASVLLLKLGPAYQSSAQAIARDDGNELLCRS